MYTVEIGLVILENRRSKIMHVHLKYESLIEMTELFICNEYRIYFIICSAQEMFVISYAQYKMIGLCLNA